MTAPGSHLNRLIELAREPSSDKRRELLRDLTDLFIAEEDQYTSQESEHFGAIMGKVAVDMDLAVRQRLADKLADAKAAPHQLIMQLAQDAIEVAKPILMRSLALQEEDLVTLAKSRGQDHLKVISTRPHVPEAVTDILVARGDDSVLEALVSNDTARISRQGMERVVVRAERNPRLHAPVSARKDLPPDLLNEMYFFVSSSLKKAILERMANIDPKEIDKALSQSGLRAVEGALPASTGLSPAEKYILQKSRDKQLNEALLLQLLRSRQTAEFLLGFARLTELDPKTAQRVLSDHTAESLAIACKASRFDRSTFSTFVLLANPTRTRTAQETSDLLALYDKVPAESAQRVMRFWKVRRQALQQGAQAASA
ncbi:MAG: DUF2336 domain-containing protein [Alphaproteobacteria bacterium]|nr:DUF2336 domain-containing protein [Alphaproteobacteria bacterium]